METEAGRVKVEKVTTEKDKTFSKFYRRHYELASK